jgi:hypothetical protein
MVTHTMPITTQFAHRSSKGYIHISGERIYSLHYKDSTPLTLDPSRPNGCISYDTCYLRILQFQGGNKLIGHKAK